MQKIFALVSRLFLWCFPDMENKALQEIGDDEPLDGLPEVLEISSGEIAERWGKIPRRAAQVLALYKIGFSQADIAKGYGIAPQVIMNYRKQYDPDGNLPIIPALGKHIAAHAFQRAALRAVSHISADKLENASAAALMTVAGIAQDKALRIKESLDADKLQADVSNLAATLRQHVQPTQLPESLDS